MQTQLVVPYIAIILAFSAVVMIVLELGKRMTDSMRRRKLESVVVAERNLGRRGLSAQAEYKPTAILESLAKLSLPEQGWQDSETKLKFVRAGLRSNKAPLIYYVIKSMVTLIIPVLAAFLLASLTDKSWQSIAFIVVLIAAAGYYTPDLIINFLSKRRATEIQQNLADLLDLLVVCVESGLGIDAAINRVSREIARSSKIVAEEFYLAGLEMRAGAGRIEALKNLAIRVNLDDLTSLVTMLVQADKFGTSLGESLRIQSEVMRLKKSQRAEELAAKIPVKLLFPLIFFIFPALLMVLIGPAILQMKSAFS
jgi:tight adherence protein C